jgi:hypothetical protein
MYSAHVHSDGSYFKNKDFPFASVLDETDFGKKAGAKYYIFTLLSWSSDFPAKRGLSN